jgi:hypothetical protein
VELEPGAQPERRALGVLGEFEVLGQRQVVVFFIAQVLDQPVVDREQEIVRAGSAVMLLRIKPSRGNVGVPRQRHLALRDHAASCGADGAHKRYGCGARRQSRDLHHPAPRQRRHGRSSRSTRPLVPEPWRDCRSIGHKPANPFGRR